MAYKCWSRSNILWKLNEIFVLTLFGERRKKPRSSKFTIAKLGCCYCCDSMCGDPCNLILFVLSVLIFKFSSIFMCKLPCKRFNILFLICAAFFFFLFFFCSHSHIHTVATIAFQRFALFITFKILIGFLAVFLCWCSDQRIFLYFSVTLWKLFQVKNKNSIIYENERVCVLFSSWFNFSTTLLIIRTEYVLGWDMPWHWHFIHRL